MIFGNMLWTEEDVAEKRTGVSPDPDFEAEQHERYLTAFYWLLGFLYAGLFCGLALRIYEIIHGGN